MSLDF